MRAMIGMLVLGLVACSAPPPAPRPTLSDKPKEREVPGTDTTKSQSGPFTGKWQSCGSADAPDQCSSYLLVQHGELVCGTWSYVATGDTYMGRVVARASSATEARRTRVCGRPGSETQTTCEAGWENIDKPLRLCNGNLADLDGKGETCFADFKPSPVAPEEMRSLMSAPWLESCLRGDADGVAP